MSEPASVTIDGRTYDTPEPRPREPGVWMLWLDDPEERISARAAAILHFRDHDRTGTAELNARPEGFGASGPGKAIVTVTLDPR